MSMEFKFNLISIIVIGFCKLSHQQICDTNRSGLICCTNYRKVNGACIACPRGSYGVNCSKACPKGFYGEFCTGKCSCSEFCDVAYGCSDNSIDAVFDVESPTTNRQTTKLKTRLREQTIEAQRQTTEHQEKITKLKDSEPGAELPTVPLALNLASVGCITLFFTICFLVMYRNTSILSNPRVNGILDTQLKEYFFIKRKKRSLTENEEQESVRPVCDEHLARRNYEALPPLEEQNVDEMMLEHDYTHIIDADSTYLEPCSLTSAPLECRRQGISPISEEQNFDEIMVEHECIDITDAASIYLEPCSLRNVPVECRRQEKLPPSEEEDIDEIKAKHEYIDIIDVDTTYLEPCSITTA